MLFDLNGKRIEKISHPENFKIITDRLSKEEYSTIMAKLNSMIGSDEVHTSSWMPKKDDWDGVFKPIAEKAAKGDFELSGMLFGLLVWKAFMDPRRSGPSLRTRKMNPRSMA